MHREVHAKTRAACAAAGAGGVDHRAGRFRPLSI
jgi:hypothetical protein